MTSRLVITAPPGAGKSTLMPPKILEELSGSGKIVMLEPRRLAARAIAERIAFNLGEEPGETVGYRMRFESRVSARTRIEVVTERLLTKMITDDPTLDGVSCVIFDEFHERSLESDLALALTLECQKTVREDLLIVLMSATIDSTQICRKLDAGHFEFGQSPFPVRTDYLDVTPAPADICRAAVRATLDSLRSDAGDILVFLPGEGEIMKCREALDAVLSNNDSVRVMPLYGMMSSKEQQEAIAPSREGQRKIVLSTPIAETSLTIEGVRCVVDSGLCRRPVFDPQTTLERLDTQRISIDMADQRAGRAGRTAPGVCHRLWSLGTQSTMASARTEEILEADLSPMLLDIALWGCARAEDLPWITPPPPSHLRKAADLLKELGATDAAGKISGTGRKMASLPCHPRLAKMLSEAESDQERQLAAEIAAALEQKSGDEVTDICSRIESLRRSRSQAFLKAARQYGSLLNVREARCIGSPDPFTAGKLLARAFPERIGRNQGNGRYLLSGGTVTSLPSDNPLASCDWIVAASLSYREGHDGRIHLAAPVAPEDLLPLATPRQKVEWDGRTGRVNAAAELRLGRLCLETKPLSEVTQEDVIRAVCAAAPKEGASMFNFSEEVANLQRRIAALSSWRPELGLPDVSSQSLLDHCADWLPAFVPGLSLPEDSRKGTGSPALCNPIGGQPQGAGDIGARKGKGPTKWEGSPALCGCPPVSGARLLSEADLRRIDLCEVVWSLLDYNQRRSVEDLAPSHITVPTGSRIPVEYRQGAELPVLRVRLQECFGLLDTPTVDGGRRKVLMELLSPGFKPVQLTSDLRSFWTGTYFEVRKELRIRYPKHSWPENPLEAEAVRGVPRKPPSRAKFEI